MNTYYLLPQIHNILSNILPELLVLYVMKLALNYYQTKF